MKKSIAVIAFVLIATLLSAATISSPAATVNLTKNKVITMEALEKEVEFYASNGVEADKLEILNAMIDDILLEQGAARDGYSLTDSEVEQLYASQKASVEAQAGRALSDEEYDALVIANFGTVDEYKAELKLQYITQMYVAGAKADVIADVAEPADKDIKSWYRQNSSSFAIPERVRLSLIVMEKTGDSATDKAKYDKLVSVYNDIKSGKITFEKGVDITEDVSSLSVAGDWGFMADTQYTRASMGDDFVDTVMLMEPGEIEGVLETPYLYVIAKCTVHAAPTVLGLDDTIEEYGITVREYIRQGLLYQNSQIAYYNALSQLLADLRKQAKINIILK